MLSCDVTTCKSGSSLKIEAQVMEAFQYKSKRRTSPWKKLSKNETRETQRMMSISVLEKPRTGTRNQQTPEGTSQKTPALSSGTREGHYMSLFPIQVGNILKEEKNTKI